MCDDSFLQPLKICTAMLCATVTVIVCVVGRHRTVMLHLFNFPLSTPQIFCFFSNSLHFYEYGASRGGKCFDECVSKWESEREAPSAVRDVKQL